MQLRKRVFNLTIVYPPTLVGEYQFRLSEWAPALSPLLTTPQHPLLLNNPLYQAAQAAFAAGSASGGGAAPPQFCPIYRIKAAQDSFGCATLQNEFVLPQAVDEMVEHHGFVEPQVRMSEREWWDDLFVFYFVLVTGFV